MRDIRFRAWDKKNKKMYQVVWLTFPSPSQNGYIFGHFNRWGQIIEESYRAKDLELMQYTGLHDKNNKRIFEGDIVKTNKREQPFVIEYGGGKFYLEYAERREDLADPLWIKIIGNIYE